VTASDPDPDPDPGFSPVSIREPLARIAYTHPAMRIVFMGTPAFAVPSLDALASAGHELLAIVAQPDRPAGRGQALREPATKSWALARGIPVLQPEKVRDGRLAEQLGQLRPEALVVTAYGRILGADLLGLAPYGAINVHGSLLPRWRGAAPIQWAIASGDRETGVTIMQMDEGLDTGDMLLQRTLPIAPEDTAESLSQRLAALGGEALVAALEGLARGAVVPVRQDPAQATLARILEKEDGRVDWSRRAQEIAARLRGFTPWPGAFTSLEGKMVKLLEARPMALDAGGATLPPGWPGAARGEAFRIAGGGLLVTCGGDTALLVKRLQPEGRPPQDALAFMNGLRRERLAFS
jgi:methionyl-tRNA formyltransferase